MQPPLPFLCQLAGPGGGETVQMQPMLENLCIHVGPGPTVLTIVTTG